MTEAMFVTDHAYFGNLCGGFGAETRCQFFTLSGPCGRAPDEHQTPERAAELEAMFDPSPRTEPPPLTTALERIAALPDRWEQERITGTMPNVRRQELRRCAADLRAALVPGHDHEEGK